MIAIIDYGVGNLFSLKSSFAALGKEAVVTNDKNDNSIFTCIRALPESTTHTLADKSLEINKGYRRQVCYIESIQGGDIDRQSLRIRQLFEDFEADYIVLDMRIIFEWLWNCAYLRYILLYEK